MLGAGDAFMAGLPARLAARRAAADALRYANACGALVVSRHGCAPAMPSWTELPHFLAHGSPHPRLRDDAALEHLHRATTRTRRWPALAVLAFDHRSQFEELAARHGAGARTHRARSSRWWPRDGASRRASAGRRGSRRRRDRRRPLRRGACCAAHRQRLVDRRARWSCRARARWLSKPATHVGLALRAWPAEHVVKCLVALHPDDPPALRAAAAGARAGALQQACTATGHELLLELIPPRELPRGADTLARAHGAIYAAGIKPDWWKLPPPREAPAWQAHRRGHRAHTTRIAAACCVLGLEASEDALRAAFAPPRRQPAVQAASRSAARSSPTPPAAWFAGRSTTPAWSPTSPRATSG